jgi:hypothetical protein
LRVFNLIRWARGVGAAAAPKKNFMNMNDLSGLRGKIPPMPDAEPDGDEGGLIPVPLASLSQPDEGEKMQAPGEGDAISMQVEATVARVEGDQAFIKVTAINGKPLDDEAEEAATDEAPSMDDQAAGLNAMLKENGGQLPS